MLHEYAIEPVALTRFETCRYILEKMDISKGRYIAKFPTDWFNSVRQACDNDPNCLPINKKKIMTLLNKISKCVLSSHYRTYDTDLEWLQNAENGHLEFPFHAIIARENPRNHPVVLPINDIYEEGNKLLKVETGIPIYRTKKDILEAVRPFLELASQIVFVDPNFSPSSRQYQITTKAFLNTIRDSGNVPKRVEYHVCGDKKNSDDFKAFKEECLKHFSGILPKGVKFRIYRWCHRFMGDRLHPRYVLTEFGGLRIDYGLDEAKDVKHGKTGQTTDVQLLADSLYLERWKQFSNPENDFVQTDSDFVEIT
jgi:hypothetical protein